MKERLVLFILVAGLTTFLYVFQFQYNTILGLLLLIAGMTLYLIYSNLATKHKKRQLKKNPQIINIIRSEKSGVYYGWKQSCPNVYKSFKAILV